MESIPPPGGGSAGGSVTRLVCGRDALRGRRRGALRGRRRGAGLVSHPRCRSSHDYPFTRRRARFCTGEMQKRAPPRRGLRDARFCMTPARPARGDADAAGRGYRRRGRPGVSPAPPAGQTPARPAQAAGHQVSMQNLPVDSRGRERGMSGIWEMRNVPRSAPSGSSGSFCRCGRLKSRTRVVTAAVRCGRSTNYAGPLHRSAVHPDPPTAPPAVKSTHPVVESR